jgi:ribosomal protein S18 acetylase RimI-like enzyme
MPDWSVRTLDWDTRLLGVAVGRLDLTGAAASAEQIEAELAQHKLRYVSARIDAGDAAAAALLERVGFRAVDELSEMVKVDTVSTSGPAASVTVRDAGEADGEAFRALASRGYVNRLSREPNLDAARVRTLYAEWAHNDLRGRTPINLLAVDSRSGGKTPLGFIAVGIEKDRPSVGFVDLVVVDPDARGRGLGEVLMLAAMRRLAERGVTSFELGVAGGNAPAVGLYRKLGFVERGRKIDYARWLA